MDWRSILSANTIRVSLQTWVAAVWHLSRSLGSVFPVSPSALEMALWCWTRKTQWRRMPGNKEIYDYLCVSLGWIFSSGGQYHGELPEIYYCYAAGFGGDRLKQRTLSPSKETYVVSMNLSADDYVMQVERWCHEPSCLQCLPHPYKWKCNGAQSDCEVYKMSIISYILF